MFGCTYSGSPKPAERQGTYIRALRVGSHPGKVRIAADLPEKEELKLHVKREGNGLAIYVLKPSSFEAEGRKESAAQTARVSPEPAAQILGATESVAAASGAGAQPVEGEVPPGGTEEAPWEKETKGGESGAPAMAERFKIFARLWNKLAHDIHEENEYESDLSNHGEIKVGAQYAQSENLRAVASVRADSFAYENGSHWDTDSDFMLDETYVNWAAGTFNLKVGNQIVRWGKADELSPLDNLNPEEVKDGLVRPREERKLPTPMVNAEIYREPLKLQGVFIPYFEKSKFDRVGTDWALFRHLNEEIGPISIDQDKPSNNLENCLAGARLSGTVRHVDLGVSYLYGRDHLPSLGSLSLPPGAPPVPSSSNLKDLYQFAYLTGQPVTLHYDRQSIYGFEFETILGEVGVRGDLAYIDKRRFLTNDLENVKKRVLQYVVGGDYHGPESIYVNLQFSQSWILDYDDSILFDKELTNTFYGKASKGFSGDRLNLTLRSFYNLTDKSFFINPALELKYWKYFDVEIGVDFLEGSQNTALGWFGDNDQAYLIVRVYL
jgi:hypothetical protein